MYYSDDPSRDFDRWNADQEAELSKLPVCSECGQPIQSEDCFEINDELICEQCLHDNHKKRVEDYVE